MRVDLSFPQCRKCGYRADTCFHENCSSNSNTPLLIDPETKLVYCRSCHKSWQVDQSTYHCNACGSIVTANEITNEIDYIIKLAKLLAAQLKYDMMQDKIINSYTNKSFFEYIVRYIHRFGDLAGYTAEIVKNLIQLIKTLL